MDKLINVTIRIPGLTTYDTEAFVFLLLLSQRLPHHEFHRYVEACSKLRHASAPIGDLRNLVAGNDVDEELATAGRVAPALSGLRGNSPRQLKRLLNNMRLSQAVAQRRGRALDEANAMKLVILERLPEANAALRSWVESGELDTNLATFGHFSDPPLGGTLQNVDPRTISDLQRWVQLSPALSAADLVFFYGMPGD